jgi:hypothetical protein
MRTYRSDKLDLIRMYGRLPEDIRQPIRALIETLAFMTHEHREQYVKNVTTFVPKVVREKAKI